MDLKMWKWKNMALGLVAVVTVACGDDPPEETGNNGNNGQNNGVDMTPAGPTWTVSSIDRDDVGLHVRIAAANGRIGVAYYGASGTETGNCDELGDMPPPKVEWSLYYAEESGGSWNVETVVQQPFVGAPPGVDLAMAPDGSGPRIAAMTGVPSEMFRYCGANDVGFFTRDGAGLWTAESVVATSAEAASGSPPSDFGEIVGYWPALAFDANGNPAVAYKDVHGGGLQSDDFRKADLEFAYGAGGWNAQPVDFGTGTGNYNDLIFDAQNRPVIATYNPTEDQDDPSIGVWAHRSEDGGANWSSVQLYNQPASEGPALALDPETGNVKLAFYHAGKGFPQLAHQQGTFDSASNGWTLEDIGDSRFDEGYEPTIGISPNGRLAVAYYRCTKATAGLGDCNVADDALIFAWEDAGEWTHEIVDEGTDGFCGRTPELGFDQDGSPLIAYRCEEPVEGKLNATVKFARRQPLP